MAKLFNSIAEVKKYAAIDFVNTYEVIEPYLAMAEEQITIDYLGQKQFDELVSFYNNNNIGTDANKLKLLDFARTIIAYNALAEYVPIGNVQLSESGIHISSTDEKKTAFEWQLNKVIASFKTISFRKLEAMLIFLESKIDVFTSWKASALYTTLIGLLVNKATIFNTYVNIANSRMKFIELMPDIRKAEDLFIIPAISQEYFDELITEIKAGNVSDDNKKVLIMLQAALSNFAYASMLHRSEGKATEYENIAHKYLKKAIEYLNTNASAEKYTVYFESDCYTAPDNYSSKFFDNDINKSIFVT